MQKNKNVLIILIAIAAVMLFLAPFHLHSQDTEETAPAEQQKEQVTEETRTALEMVLLPHNTGWKFFASLSNYYKLSIAIFFAVLLKFLLLKRKLALPFQLATMEKLVVSTISETIFEIMLFLVLLIFFAPLSTSLLSKLGMTLVQTKSSQFLGFLGHTLMTLPYHCVIGGLLTITLVEVNSPIQPVNRNSYFLFATLSALIVPTSMILLNGYYTLFFA